MASAPLTHVIAFTALILVLISIYLYAMISVTSMVNENIKVVLRTIADSYASVIRHLVVSKYNGSIVRINSPVEIASRKYYNVYIGYGWKLSEMFPEIKRDPEYSDYALYVVVALPDLSVRAYSVAVPETSKTILLGRGRLVRELTETGFKSWEGYEEEGIPWLCRMPINVTERSGTRVSDYLVMVTLDLNRMTCTYGGKVYRPSRNDIRFTGSDGRTRLDYWIEYWNETEGVARIWVKIPSLDPGSAEHIFAYWGQPLANDASDPGIFALFTDLSQYNDLAELLLSGVWHLSSVRASYSSGKYNIIYNGVSYSGLAINAVFEKGVKEAYLNIFSLPYFTVDSTGWIVEVLGAPLSSPQENVHDFRISWYNSSEALPLGFRVEMNVYDSYNRTDTLDDYTIIWGDWGIECFTEVNGTCSEYALEGINTDELGDGRIHAAAIMRSNEEFVPVGPGEQLGHENFTFLAKLYIEPDNTTRGIVIANELYINDSETKSLGIGLRYEEVNGSGQVLRLVEVGFPVFSSTDLHTVDLDTVGLENYRGWVYLVVSVKGPGAATPKWDIYVYGEDGTLILEHHFSGTPVGGLEPNYIGLFTYSDQSLSIIQPLQVSSYFQYLVSTRYDYDYIRSLIGKDYLDISRIYVLGLDEGWSITIYDSGSNKAFNATVESDGIAYIDVLEAPILGLNGALFFEIRDQYGNLAYYFKHSVVIPGGSIIEFDMGIGSFENSVMTGIHSINGEWNAVVNVNGASYSEIQLTPSPQGVPAILGVGLYANTTYYFVRDVEYNTINETSATFPANSVFRIVFGLAKTINPEVSTSGFYGWIRVRPFVYPEPAVAPWYDAIGSLAVEEPPVIEYEVVEGYIVFSSTLLVDLALVVEGDEDCVVVALYSGARAG